MGERPEKQRVAPSKAGKRAQVKNASVSKRQKNVPQPLHKSGGMTVEQLKAKALPKWEKFAKYLIQQLSKLKGYQVISLKQFMIISKSGAFLLVKFTVPWVDHNYRQLGYRNIEIRFNSKTGEFQDTSFKHIDNKAREKDVIVSELKILNFLDDFSTLLQRMTPDVDKAVQKQLLAEKGGSNLPKERE